MNILRQLLVPAMLAALVGSVQAAPVLIYNTGVDASGAPRADNAPELHYTLISPSPVTGTPFVTTSGGGFPVGPWIDDSAASAWIAPSPDTEGVIATYIYRTTLDLTDFDPATAVLTGRWSADNAGVDIYLNSQAMNQSAADFLSWSGFSLASGFTSGINTIDFAVVNRGGPTGLRVEFINAQADRLVVPAAVAEPHSLALAGMAFMALFARRRNGAPVDAPAI